MVKIPDPDNTSRGVTLSNEDEPPDVEADEIDVDALLDEVLVVDRDVAEFCWMPWYCLTRIARCANALRCRSWRTLTPRPASDRARPPHDPRQATSCRPAPRQRPDPPPNILAEQRVRIDLFRFEVRRFFLAVEGDSMGGVVRDRDLNHR